MTDLAATAQLKNYYRWHSWIYDYTRWAFLFGRNKLVRLAAEGPVPFRILEVGCGTGSNLVELARLFPAAEIVGLDCSPDMLEMAKRKIVRFGARVSLRQGAYRAPIAEGRPFDLIVFSYCLSMINPGYDEVLEHCVQDLHPAGRVAAVDFHNTPHAWFRRWMSLNHVRMEGHLAPAIAGVGLRCSRMEIARAYGGVWSWFTWIGSPALDGRVKCRASISL